VNPTNGLVADTGERVWRSELSMIDSALLIADPIAAAALVEVVTTNKEMA
jgi:hypothetical protein